MCVCRIVLYLYCIVSYRIVSYWYRIVSYCIVLYRIVSYCIVLYRIVSYCIVLFCFVLFVFCWQPTRQPARQGRHTYIRTYVHTPHTHTHATHMRTYTHTVHQYCRYRQILFAFTLAYAIALVSWHRKELLLLLPDAVVMLAFDFPRHWQQQFFRISVCLKTFIASSENHIFLLNSQFFFLGCVGDSIHSLSFVWDMLKVWCCSCFLKLVASRCPLRGWVNGSRLVNLGLFSLFFDHTK